MIGRSLLYYNQLLTMLAQIQAVINSPSLLYVEDEITDVLTPNHFIAVPNFTVLYATTVDNVLDPNFKPVDSITLLLSMWKKGHRRLDQFWSSWKNEYLLSLRWSQHSQHKQRCTAINVTSSVNGIVQIKDDTPRGMWGLGRITDLHTCSNGQVCAASVKTAEKNVLRRSICHLFPLEQSRNSTPQAAIDNRDNDVQPRITPHPKRNAAAISELLSHVVFKDASYMVTACLSH